MTRLLFQQRMFSWFDSYDIYDENQQTLFVVRGRPAWGHKLEIYDARQQYLGMVKEEVLTLLPRFDLYVGDACIGQIKKEFTLFRPRYTLDCNGWQVEGDWFEWEYEVLEGDRTVMRASKELLHWTDTYAIEVERPQDVLLSLMIVLAIDAAKCSSGS